MTPLVSIIIPCYNTGKYVGEAIQSALDQTMPDLEVIVVDDGSTDDSPEVICRFTDRRVRTVRQANRGLAAARNTGIRQARGQYLSFLDADDTLLPDKLAIQTDWLESNPEYGLVSGGIVRTDERGREIHRNVPPTREIELPVLLVSGRFTCNAPLLRRSFVELAGGFDETLKAAEDWDFFCRCGLAGCRMYQLRKPVCTYRMTPGSMYSNVANQTREYERVIAKLYVSPSMPALFLPLRSKALSKAHMEAAIRLFILQRSMEARTYLNQALREDPSWLEGADPLASTVHYMARFSGLPAGEPILRAILGLVPSDISCRGGWRRNLIRRVRFLDVRSRGNGGQGIRSAALLLRQGFFRMVLRGRVPWDRPSA